ncbi:MAG: hypothetical protein O3C40_15015 [Planctomycetota bacterium]|nr:hypothetical protein [Planctomycetota bacterium]
MNKDPQARSSDFSDSIQELRDEMRRDVRGLANAIERRPNQKPGVSPLAVVASVFGSLFVGAAGMSVYDAQSQTAANSSAPQADVRAELQAVVSPYTQRLDGVAQALDAAQQAATENSKAHGLLLDSLAQTVASLQESAEVQSTAFHERVDLLADELVAKIARAANADGEPTVAARQPIPKIEGSAVQPATAEADVTDAEDDLVTVDKKPADPAANAPERGELIIDNPSEYDLKLLINGEPLEIKARGVTTIDVTVGTVKTQIASIPSLVQNWDKWGTVDGVKRLTITVESGDGLYRLR